MSGKDSTKGAGVTRRDLIRDLSAGGFALAAGAHVHTVYSQDPNGEFKVVVDPQTAGSPSENDTPNAGNQPEVRTYSTMMAKLLSEKLPELDPEIVERIGNDFAHHNSLIPFASSMLAAGLTADHVLKDRNASRMNCIGTAFLLSAPVGLSMPGTPPQGDLKFVLENQYGVPPELSGKVAEELWMTLKVESMVPALVATAVSAYTARPIAEAIERVLPEVE